MIKFYDTLKYLKYYVEAQFSYASVNIMNLFDMKRFAISILYLANKMQRVRIQCYAKT